MTHNRLSHQDISSFFQQLYQAAINFKDMKLKVTDVILAIICMALDVILFMLGLSVLSEIGDYDSEFDDPELDNYLFGFGLGTIIMSIVLYAGIVYKFATRKKNNQGKIRERMNNYLDQINPYFSRMGLRWRLPENSVRWIELWLDFRYAEGMRTERLQNTDTNTNNQNKYPTLNYPTYQTNTQPNNNYSPPSFLIGTTHTNPNPHVSIRQTSEQSFLNQALLGTNNSPVV